MNKIKHDFQIPESEKEAFDRAYKKLTGDSPFWRAIWTQESGEVVHICTLSVSKYELLYLRLAVAGGHFIDLEARERALAAEKANRQQTQSDTTQPQMA